MRVPICLDTQDPQEIIRIVQTLAPTFGGINLEDISAPRCFEIEEKLQALLDIPVFHDDQHGTAVVVAAALINCAKVTNIAIGDLSVLVNGAGAAGTAITKMLMSIGVKDILVCDKNGIINGDDESLNPYMRKLATQTNLAGQKGMLVDGIRGRKVFIGRVRSKDADRRNDSNHGKRSHCIRYGEPGTRNHARSGKIGGRGHCGNAAVRIFPTKSTTSWFSPGCSKVPSLFGPIRLRNP